MSEKIDLSKFCYNPKLGYVSADKFYRKLKKLGVEISREDVDKFLGNQLTNQLNKNIQKPSEFNSINANHKLQSVQLDIMVYDRYEYHHYKYIICIIDV